MAQILTERELSEHKSAELGPDEVDMTAESAATVASTPKIETPAQLRRRMIWMYIWAATFGGSGLSYGIILVRHAFSRGLPFDQPAKLHILWGVVLIALTYEAILPIVRSFRSTHTRKNAFFAVLIAVATSIATAILIVPGFGA